MAERNRNEDSMNLEWKEKIKMRFAQQTGHTGFYYKDLVTGETFGHLQSETYLAASVIKLPMFMAIMKWASEGRVSLEERITVTQEDKVPICGALTLFTDEPEVDIRTLCRLMISLSDNTATNVLIRRFGVTAFQEEFRQWGLKGTQLNRPMFQKELAAQGIQNYIVPEEMGQLLEQIYRRTFVSEEVSAEINDTLLLQQINHKIPGVFGEGIAAHKTGEDENLTNDVGIVYAKNPFIVCFAGHDTNVYRFETLIREVSAELYELHNV
jgi:beta-lactamase class A